MTAFAWDITAIASLGAVLLGLLLDHGGVALAGFLAAGLAVAWACVEEHLTGGGPPWTCSSS